MLRGKGVLVLLSDIWIESHTHTPIPITTTARLLFCIRELARDLQQVT